MRYVLDISEMTLVDLLNVKSQALLGLLEMDGENLDLLCEYIQLRTELVNRLERLYS